MTHSHPEINMEPKHHILLVEDDAFLRGLISDELAERGYFVVAKENGLEALSFLDSNSMDAVITDIFMPDMDGFELIRSLRKRDSTLPIFALSGGVKDRHHSANYLKMARVFGANEIFAKPVEMAELIAKLEQHCRRSAEEPD